MPKPTSFINIAPVKFIALGNFYEFRFDVILPPDGPFNEIFRNKITILAAGRYVSTLLLIVWIIIKLMEHVVVKPCSCYLYGTEFLRKKNSWKGEIRI